MDYEKESTPTDTASVPTKTKESKSAIEECKDFFRAEFWSITITLASVIIIFSPYLLEQFIIHKLIWNSPYQLEQFCNLEGSCLNVEQHYSWNDEEGNLTAHRVVMSAGNIALSAAALKTPEAITLKHLEPDHWEVDHANLPRSNDIVQIAAGFALDALSFEWNDGEQKVLQLGMGSGAATGYLSLMPFSLRLDVVESEPTVYAADKKWFAFPSLPNVNLHIVDGALFVKQAASNGTRYASIILNVPSNYPDGGIICPHKAFLQEEVIAAMSRLIRPDGVLSSNLLMIKDQERLEKEVVDRYSAHFKTCFPLKYDSDDGKKIIICSNSNAFDWMRQRERIIANLAVFDGVMGTKLGPHFDQLNPSVVDL